MHHITVIRWWWSVGVGIILFAIYFRIPLQHSLCVVGSIPQPPSTTTITTQEQRHHQQQKQQQHSISTHRIPQEIIKVRSCIFVFFFAFQYTHPHPPTSPRKNNIANRTKEGAIYIYILYSSIVVDSSPRNRSTITKQFLWHPPAYALANFFPPKRDSTQTPPPIIVNFFFCVLLSIIAEQNSVLYCTPNQINDRRW